MKWIKQLTKISLSAIGVAFLALSSCVSDDIIGNLPDDNNPGSQVVKPANRFAAFRIRIHDDNETRADVPHDGNYEDGTYDDGTYNPDESNKHLRGYFNKGLEFERALYFPSTDTEVPEEDDDEKKDDNAGDNTKDPQPSTPEFTQSYHFAILFNQDGELETPEPLPLELTKKSDEENDDVTVYMKYYDPQVEENPFEEFAGNVLIVLNASYDLEKELRTKLAEQSSNPFYTIRKLILQKPQTENGDPDSYLYLKDKKGRYITDKDGYRYFTMTSSMVINGNSVVPAIDGQFTTYPSKQEAEANPTSLYIERLPAKYTVLFKGDNKMSIGWEGSMTSATSGKNYYLTSDSYSTSIQSQYLPTHRMVITPSGVDASGKIIQGSTPKELKYVNDYERSDAIGDRKSVNVRTTTNWKINIIGWGINGVEQKEYLFKNLNSNQDYTTKDWFEISKDYRNYWAEDPDYLLGPQNYPDQYREARFVPQNKDQGSNVPSYQIDENVKHTEDLGSLDGVSRNGGLLKELSLDYLSFSDLSNRNVRSYVPEHTFDASQLTDHHTYSKKGHLRVGTHLIIAAQLLIQELEPGNQYGNIYDANYFDAKDGSVVSSRWRPVSKYYMNDIYWDEISYKNYVIEYLGYWMLTEENKEIFGNNDGIFYVNEDGAIAEEGDFLIEQAHIKGGDAMVWVKPADGITLYAKDPTTGEYNPITEAQYRNLSLQHTNYMAECFNEGFMYYAVGSLHGRDSFPAADAEAETGDYGTVRNNWYYFTIDGFTAPGTPVSVTDQPIIPNNGAAETALGVSIKILDWHIQPEDVDVSDQRRPND